MTDRQLAAAMADLAEFGWVILDDWDDAFQLCRTVILGGVPAEHVSLRGTADGRPRLEVSGEWISEQLAWARDSSFVAVAGRMRLFFGSRPWLFGEIELGRSQVIRLLSQAIARGRARLAVLLDPGQVRQVLVRYALSLPEGEEGRLDGRAQGA